MGSAQWRSSKAQISGRSRATWATNRHGPEHLLRLDRAGFGPEGARERRPHSLAIVTDPGPREGGERRVNVASLLHLVGDGDHDLPQRPERDALAVGQASATQHDRSGRRGGRELVEQSRLAHAADAQNRDQVAAAVHLHVLEHAPEHAHLAVAIHERPIRLTAPGRGRVQHELQPARDPLGPCPSPPAARRASPPRRPGPAPVSARPGSGRGAQPPPAGRPR